MTTQLLDLKAKKQTLKKVSGKVLWYFLLHYFYKEKETNRTIKCEILLCVKFSLSFLQPYTFVIIKRNDHCLFARKNMQKVLWENMLF